MSSFDGTAEGMAYVYVLRDPRDGAIRYAGVTRDRWAWGATAVLAVRLRGHLAQRPSANRVVQWVSLLRGMGLTPVIHLVSAVPAAEALAVERQWISYLCNRGEQLLNTAFVPRPMAKVRRRQRTECRYGQSLPSLIQHYLDMGQNKTQVAKSLGCSTVTLYRWLADQNIEIVRTISVHFPSEDSSP